MRKAAATTAGAAALGLLLTSRAVRALPYSIHIGVDPFHAVSAGGAHVHHMGKAGAFIEVHLG